MRIDAEHRRELPCDIEGFWRTQENARHTHGSIGMLKQVRLPHRVRGQVFRVLQPCLRKMAACPVHVTKCHTTLLLSVWSISRHSLQLPDVVNGQMACGENI